LDVKNNRTNNLNGENAEDIMSIPTSLANKVLLEPNVKESLIAA
jgi:hypothetical protein